MENLELQKIWKSYDQKMERIIAVNKDIAIDITRQKLNRRIGQLNRPKWIAILIGLPYIFLLVIVMTIAFMAKAYFVALGFGVIALLMMSLLIAYCYQLYLISQVRHAEDVLSTQRLLSKLKTSSFNCLRLAVFQLPFWSICWVSLDALASSPFIYGGINLLVFLILAYMSFYLYQKLSYNNKDSKIRDFFLSGNEWDPILKSTEILEQIKAYEE